MRYKRFLFVAPIPNVSNRTRAIKIGRILTGNGFELSFWGWQRERSDQIEEDLLLNDKRLIFKTAYISIKFQRYLYPFWVLVVFIRLLSVSKETVVWSLGLESALPAVLASKIKKFKIVFDDADRLVLLKKYNFLLKKLIIYIEKYVSKNVSRHIVPSLRRYDYSSPSHFELKNTPNLPDFKKAKSSSKFNWLTSNTETKLVVYVNGWLKDLRGFNVLNQVAETLKEESICWVVAGRSCSELASEFISRKEVVYLEELSNIDSLSVYKYVDFVLTYYDPVIPINRYAESNKWGDAIFFGVPIIYNSEVITADFIKSKRLGIGFEYHDQLSLVNFLSEVANNQILKNNYNKLDVASLPSFQESVLEIANGFNNA